MAKTPTQRAVQLLTAQLAHLPAGTPVDVAALVRGLGLPVQPALVARRLRERGLIAGGRKNGWVRSGRPPRLTGGGREAGPA